MTSLRITKDRRIFLNEQEIKKCLKLSVIMEGGCDPEIELKPVSGQIDDLLMQARKTAEQGNKVLVTTLTKNMAERLTDYL